MATDRDILAELITGLDIAVTNARDLDTLRALIGDTVERAILVARDERPPCRLNLARSK